MNEEFDVVIVGAGHGGAQAAMMLRQHGFAGSVLMLGAEPELPYDRPALSKEYLAGEKTWDRIVFRTAEAWTERGIALRLGEEVVEIDPGARRVVTTQGKAYGYGHLIWSAGGDARNLSCSGAMLAGVHSVRNRADVLRMLDELSSVDEVAVIGGGYIGLEAASVLVQLGKRVTLLEAMDRVLSRVAGEPLSRFYEAEHRGKGVDLRLNTTVACIEETAGRATGVRLATGELVAAQLVIVGIGIVPSVDPLLRAGADGSNGVRVDGQCRTSLEKVFAIGDCAEHRNRFASGEWIRLESVQNANDQANVVAQTIMGVAAEYDAVPWFWSNQYDLRLQTVGLFAGSDSVVVRGSPESRAFSVIYLKEGRVVALDCVNTVRDYVHGKALVLREVRPALSDLQDMSTPLKALIG